MARKYTGNSDGAAKGKRPGTEKLVDLCHRRWDSKNLGTWVVRDMRGKPGQLSVHATGRAADIQFPNDKVKAQAVDWFVAHADALGIEEIHVYDAGKWGKGWRVGRGWKQWTESDNGGTPGADWLHVEISPEFADDAEEFEAAWRSLPKPA
jgi:hypothetical protein